MIQKKVLMKDKIFTFRMTLKKATIFYPLKVVKEVTVIERKQTIVNC